MSIIKSFSVGNGDMFYINHNSANLTIIDCSMNSTNRERIVNELIQNSTNKEIIRFISTHPDEDHISGLEYLDQKMPIQNFYCVKNEATKNVITAAFTKYCELRDSATKSFYIEKGSRRKWMNESGPNNNGVEIGASGINILWPVTENEFYKQELEFAKNGGSPNNISAIITYSLQNGITAMWMGDLETEFLISIEPELNLSQIDILFAPHHGRDSAKIPEEYLQILNPKIVVIGEAPSQHLNYYSNYNTITQNTAGDILFDCDSGEVDIYVSNQNYSVNFLNNKGRTAFNYYLGTLTI
ncbi:hypothetical protein [Ferruginibacter sp. SUN106]|uniref:hypothetical protein n=1 Tax=Ferruginibacter sp. SUN106 TaxID=2978348 RepID=UPI003D36255D